MQNAVQLGSGSEFAGDFVIERPLGEGGMGAVYVALQKSTGKRRALKLMQPQLVADPKSRQRFEQEARVGARIESDHVVEVVTSGVDERTGVPYLAMELLDGEPLSELLARRGVLEPWEVREIFVQMGHALASAHRAGIVHRDLKPENIFVARPRRQGVPFTVKVLDFGIAKVVEEARNTSQQTATLGTPFWMAPEQADRNGTIGPPCDVWALGLIAFRLLTGRHFWRAANDPKYSLTVVLREMLFEPLPTASARAAELYAPGGVSPAFDDWFARCVQRDPSLRFPDAGAARDALDALLSPGPMPSQHPPPQHAPSQHAPPTYVHPPPFGPYGHAPPPAHDYAPAPPHPHPHAPPYPPPQGYAQPQQHGPQWTPGYAQPYVPMAQAPWAHHTPYPPPGPPQAHYPPVRPPAPTPGLAYGALVGGIVMCLIGTFLAIACVAVLVEKGIKAPVDLVAWIILFLIAAGIPLGIGVFALRFGLKQIRAPR